MSCLTDEWPESYPWPIPVPKRHTTPTPHTPQSAPQRPRIGLPSPPVLSAVVPVSPSPMHRQASPVAPRARSSRPHRRPRPTVLALAFSDRQRRRLWSDCTCVSVLRVCACVRGSQDCRRCVCCLHTNLTTPILFLLGESADSPTAPKRASRRAVSSDRVRSNRWRPPSRAGTAQSRRTGASSPRPWDLTHP